MKKVLSWLDNNLEEFLLVILLGAMSVVMMVQIILRTTGNSLSWAEEFCRYCFVYSGMLSAGYCLRRKVGIRVDLITNALPAPIRIFLEYFSRVLTIALYGYLFYNSFGLIATTTSVSSAMQLPIKYVYAAFPLGFGLGVIRGIQDVVFYTRETFQPKKKTASSSVEGSVT